jgi:hypothetical protein
MAVFLCIIFLIPIEGCHVRMIIIIIVVVVVLQHKIYYWIIYIANEERYVRIVGMFFPHMCIAG